MAPSLPALSDQGESKDDVNFEKSCGFSRPGEEGSRAQQNDHLSIMALPNEVHFEIIKYIAFPDTVSLRSTNRHFHALMPDLPILNMPLEFRIQICKALGVGQSFTSLHATCHNFKRPFNPFTRQTLAAAETCLHVVNGRTVRLACYTCLRLRLYGEFPIDPGSVLTKYIPIRNGVLCREASIKHRKDRSWSCIRCLREEDGE